MAEFQFLDEGTSEAQNRLATSFLFAQSSTGLARTGVLSGLVVSQTTTASVSVNISAGAAPIQSSVLAGVALMVLDTTKTLDVLTANPVGSLPRNDIVVFDSVTKLVSVIVGVPNASPTDPTVPATACPLARLRHAANATTIPAAKIDDLRSTTRLAGALGPRTSYTPALTGVTLGNGTLTGTYRLTDGLLDVGASLQFGSTTTWGGAAGTDMALGLPTGMTSTSLQTISAWIYNAATGYDHLAAGRISAGSATVYFALNGTFAASVHGSRPFAWATGALLVMRGSIEVTAV